MKAYFTASIVGKSHYEDKYQRIVTLLNERGVSTISDHILNTSEERIHLETKEERLKFQEQLERWINEADCMVAETSFPSISVGYEISLALHKGKPVLVLFSNGHAPSLLAHHKDEKYVCEHYTNDSLPTLIDDFLHYIGSKADTRFTFFITPDIAQYLETVSKEKKLPKSVYLRKLIEADQKHHFLNL